VGASSVRRLALRFRPPKRIEEAEERSACEPSAGLVVEQADDDAV